MAFDFSDDHQTMMDMFANCDVSVKLSEVQVLSFRAIFDISSDSAAAFQSDLVVFKPSLTGISSDVAQISSAHVMDIARDGLPGSKQYKFDGKPRPDGAGLTVVHLGEKT